MPVWIYSATGDTVVTQKVVNKTAQYFNYFGSNIEYIHNHPGGHVFPTNLSVNNHTCFDEVMPYIGNCGFDGVKSMWEHIMPNQDKEPLKPRDLNWKNYGDLIKFNQTEFIDHNYTTKTAGMNPNGYIYQPHNCKKDGKKCKLHVAIHGCHQSIEYLNTEYIEDTGYLPWAATNDVIVLFP